MQQTAPRSMPTQRDTQDKVLGDLMLPIWESESREIVYQQRRISGSAL